jgi:hypothetical protein
MPGSSPIALVLFRHTNRRPTADLLILRSNIEVPPDLRSRAGGDCVPEFERVPSEEVKKRAAEPNPRRHGTARLEAHVDTNPIRPAEQRYVQEHGSVAHDQLLARLFEELFHPRENTSALITCGNVLHGATASRIVIVEESCSSPILPLCPVLPQP